MVKEVSNSGGAKQMVLNYHMGALGQVGFFCLIVFCVFVCVLNMLTPKHTCFVGFFVFQSSGRLSSLFLLNALCFFTFIYYCQGDVGGHLSPLGGLAMDRVLVMDVWPQTR